MLKLIGKTQGRESIAAKFTANLITAAGADRVLACDLHSGQSMGYFDISCFNIVMNLIGDGRRYDRHCCSLSFQNAISSFVNLDIVANTIPLKEHYFPQMTVLSVANLLGETIWHVHDDSFFCCIFYGTTYSLIGLFSFAFR
ncbi:ribose-phosphate pyrophosphokinase 1, chloroplastic [Artemisia annua]|uniref:Ribose-phosphate pyrophosphokinase 1, chloroplastic n=1 Tax=Artemisia annua TaxID=35608 RepID=A0A2U1QCS7_ARTAN|nr:ribose-phosphate pyrophosphokinase 1, chloroplastic [Artemisia annua]